MKEGILEMFDNGIWEKRFFKLTEGKLLYFEEDGSKLLGWYPVDQTSFVFPRPDKDGRVFVFSMLTIREGKSVNLEANAQSQEEKLSWVSALRTANVASTTGNIRSPRVNNVDSNSGGLVLDADKKKANLVHGNGSVKGVIIPDDKGSDGDKSCIGGEKDCVCMIM